MPKIKAVFNWSGGKDSAHALLRALQSRRWEITALLTTVNRDTRLSTMHGIPVGLLRAQADSIGIPLHIVELTPRGDIDDYSRAMRQAVETFRAQGVSVFIFGDIFLRDIRRYREEQLAPYGIKVEEPLWSDDSRQTMRDFLASGIKCVAVTADASRLDGSVVGRPVDDAFVESLPDDVDPNGENGEYHTFCYDGPIFSTPVRFRLGETVLHSHTVRLDDGSEQTYACHSAAIYPEPVK